MKSVFCVRIVCINQVCRLLSPGFAHNAYQPISESRNQNSLVNSTNSTIDRVNIWCTNSVVYCALRFDAYVTALP